MTLISPTDSSERLDDWVNRLNALYDRIDSWILPVPGIRARRGALRQPNDLPLCQLGPAFRDVPTYTLFKGKHRLAFVPSALSLPGANGRINVTSNAKQHILVDRGTEGRGINWQLIVEDLDRPLVPLNRSRLLRLLTEGG